NKAHAVAQRLADLYRKVALPGVAEERLGEAVEAEAKDVLEAARGGGPEAAARTEQARALYRTAAAAYEKAAEGRAPGEQTQLLRRCAACHLQAEDHARAVQVLERVVALDMAPPDFLAEAWYTLAGAHVALRQGEQAYQAYYKCLNYPPSTITHRARYQLA